jgi:hypothetical protein
MAKPKLMTIPRTDRATARWTFDLGQANDVLQRAKCPEINLEWAAKVGMGLETMENALARVKGNPELSELGRENAKRRAGVAAHAVVEEFLATSDAEWDRRTAQVQSQELTPPTPSDLTTQLIEELRTDRILRGLGITDPLLAEMIFPDAPDAVKTALLSAPPVLLREESGEARLVPLLSAETREAHTMAMAKARNPAAHHRLEAYAELKRVHKNLAEGARKLIEERTGISGQPDAIIEAARGDGDAA